MARKKTQPKKFRNWLAYNASIRTSAGPHEAEQGKQHRKGSRSDEKRRAIKEYSEE